MEGMMLRGTPAASRNQVRRALWVVTVALGVGFAGRVQAQELRLAELGTCPLESGEGILGCVVGYRTAGVLNEDASNAVLFPTWGNGTSEQLLGGYVRPDGWVSPDDHFVIMVDLFGNGVSSSPSNSRDQPGDAFPAFTIRDAVRAQHRLVTEVLGLEGLHAVVGISLGALAAFEWTTTFPGFVANAVPVVGTPRVSPYDVLRNDLARRILAACAPDRCDEARETYFSSFLVLVRSPAHWNRTLSREDVAGLLASIPRFAGNLPSPEDILSQGRALDRMDLTEPFGGSMERAAEAVESRMLIVVATHDGLVTPEASREFARLTGASLVELESDCGHQVFVCEGDALGRRIRDFLR
jgi:homoserine O-acetyltransferase/O-succinyltransferase